MKHVTTLLLSMVILPLCAQQNGVRLIAPELQFGESGPNAFDFIGIGVGYDHKFNDRIAMGVDVVFPYILGERRVTDRMTDGGWQATYWVTRAKTFAISYRTSYCFNSRDRGAYIGSFIGATQRKETYDIGYATDTTTFEYDFNGGPFPKGMTVSQLVFPVGLRLGLKFRFDKGYADFYGSAGYQIGNGSVEYDAPPGLLDDYGITTTPIMYSVGFAIGAYTF